MSYIKSKIIYHDKLSQASSYPYVIKAKNKLAGHCVQEELGVYLFFVLNSSDSALIKRFTVEFNNTEHIIGKHIDFKTKYMSKEVGYCDVTRYELMTHAEVISKKLDTRNKFVKVGTIENSKWKEIQDMVSSPEFRSDRRGGSKNPTVLSELILGVNNKETAQVLIFQLGI